MRRLLILKIAFVFVLAFIIVGSYFWYLYFNTKEEKLLSESVRLELLNNGKSSYENAGSTDDEGMIPGYYFRVKNNLNADADYVLLLNEVNNGQNNSENAISYQRNELLYELKLDNKIIKKGRLSDLSNDILDSNTIPGNTTYEYSLKISVASDTDSTIEKYYYYSVDLKENNEKVS